MFTMIYYIEVYADVLYAMHILMYYMNIYFGVIHSVYTVYDANC